MAPLLGNRFCHVNHVVPHSLQGRSHVISQVRTWYRSTHYWVIAIFIGIRYVTLYRWPLTLTFELCLVMPLGWSIPVLSLNMIRHTVPELGRLQFSIDRQLKVPIFTCLGIKRSNFIFSLSNPQNTLPWLCHSICVAHFTDLCGCWSFSDWSLCSPILFRQKLCISPRTRRTLTWTWNTSKNCSFLLSPSATITCSGNGTILSPPHCADEQHVMTKISRIEWTSRKLYCLTLPPGGFCKI